jgi:hypothetical protein
VRVFDSLVELHERYGNGLIVVVAAVSRRHLNRMKWNNEICFKPIHVDTPEFFGGWRGLIVPAAGSAASLVGRKE